MKLMLNTSDNLIKDVLNISSISNKLCLLMSVITFVTNYDFSCSDTIFDCFNRTEMLFLFYN